MNFQPSESILNSMNDLTLDVFPETKSQALSYHIFNQVVHNNKYDVAVVSDDVISMRKYLNDLFYSYSPVVHGRLDEFANLSFMIEQNKINIVLVKGSIIKNTPGWFFSSSKDLVVVDTNSDVRLQCTKALDQNEESLILG